MGATFKSRLGVRRSLDRVPTPTEPVQLRGDASPSDFASSDEPSATENERNQVSSHGLDSHRLHPPDHGRQAWLFLCACFLLEGVVWGFPFSFGVFQAYYSTREPFASQPSGIPAIGTTSTGLCYFASPLAAIVFQAWPQTRRIGTFLGLVIIVVSLIAASFCNNVPALLATQGVLYSIGSLIIYFPAISFIDEWFITRKGIAYGTMWAGTGVSGAIVPFLTQWLLNQYGYRTALRVWAICVFVIITPCLYFIRPRLPVTAVNALRPKDLSFAKHAPFWLFETGVILQSLGFFLPQLWMPSFALSLGLPAFAGSLSVALVNASSAVGSILIGILADRFHVSVPVLLCTLGSAIGAFVFWGLTTAQPMLYIFAIIWGAFGGGYIATWSGKVAVISRSEETGNVNTGMVMGLLAAGKGIGAVVSGPVSSKLLSDNWSSHADFAYGTAYGSLIVFTGVSAVLGGISCIGRVFKML